MIDSNRLETIRNDLHLLRERWVVVHGSTVEGSDIPGRSDIDIAIVTRSSDRAANLDAWKEVIGLLPPVYDVRIFELFPLHVKMNIIDRHQVVYGDPLEMSEYFYQFRKEWKDVRPRYEENQFSSIEEKLEGIARRKALVASSAHDR